MTEPEWNDWDVDAPPPGFADRVVAAATIERAQATGRRRRARGVAAVVAGLAVAAGAALAVRSVGTHAPTRGEAIARERIEIPLGDRAVAVLEAGARVRWNGDEVVQDDGDAFYRVASGARFKVRTPAADAEVQGTCFRVKVRGAGSGSDGMTRRDWIAGGVGAAIGALTFVGVYEGKVAVSKADARVELTAGESATADGRGVQKGALDAEKAFDDAARTEHGADPLLQANANLAASVREYKTRLEALEHERGALEGKLAAAETRLARAADGAPPRAEWDLTPEDWTDLAKKGEMRYRLPCTVTPKWTAKPATLDRLGLAPSDVPALKESFKRSNDRVWASVRPLCQQALGVAVEVVDKLGADTCEQLIRGRAFREDEESARAAYTYVAEVRAGLRPAPGPNENVAPLTRLMLTLTGELATWEKEMAGVLGPEEAHRLATDDESLCMQSSVFRSGPPRAPAGASPK